MVYTLQATAAHLSCAGGWICILMNLIKIGEGLSLLPYFAEQSHTEKELIQIPVSDVDCYRYICLRPNCNVYETELAQKFQQFCINFFAKIEKDR